MRLHRLYALNAKTVNNMKKIVPGTEFEFEIPDEWWIDAGMKDYVPCTEHYHTNLSVCTAIVLLKEVEPPQRDNGFWFRNKESVLEVLRKMRDEDEVLEPIEVWSLAKKASKKYIVRDGFHRFYLSIAAGFRKIPIKISDFVIEDLSKIDSLSHS